MKRRKRNRMFIEWYENRGQGYENCIGKTEEEKLQKSTKELLFKKE